MLEPLGSFDSAGRDVLADDPGRVSVCRSTPDQFLSQAVLQVVSASDPLHPTPPHMQPSPKGWGAVDTSHRPA